MNQRCLALVLSLLLGLTIVAAFSDAGLAQTTIRFWHVWSGDRIPLVEKLVADFEALNPGIKVEHELIPQSAMIERYLTAIAGGNPPDVIQIHGGRHFATFADRGALLSLDPFIEADGMDPYEIFYAHEFNNYVWEGTTYAMPLATGGAFYMLFYDKDHFAAAGLDPDVGPSTWRDLEEYAARLTVRNANGSYERIGFNPFGIENFPYSSWLFTNNGYLVSQDARQVRFSEPEGVETLKWMVEFTDRLYGGFNNILPFVGRATAVGWAMGREFYTDQVSMHVTGAWHFLQLQANAPDKNYGVWDMPYNDANPEASLRIFNGGGWAYAIPRNSKNAQAAWKFIKYATAEEGNLNFFKAQWRPSPVKAFNEDPYFWEVNPYWDVVVRSLEMAELSPVIPPQPQIDDVIHQMTEMAMMGQMKPDAAINWAARQVQHILDEYWSGR